MIKGFTRTLILSIICLIPIGCTTIGGKTQKVKINTNPPGAEVYFEGENIGTTPHFFDLRRRKAGEITIKKKGYEDTTFKLNSSYRWGDSFASNFIWAFYGAPIGWYLDYQNESAWYYHKVDSIELKLKSGEKPSTEKLPQVIAIAPPQYKDDLISDELGEKLQAVLQKRYPNAKILEYNTTKQTFDSYNYTNTEKVGRLYDESLYHDLGVTHVAQTDAEIQKNEGIKANVKIDNIYSDKTEDTFLERLPGSAFKANLKSNWGRQIYSFASILPNTFGVDFATPSANVQVKESSQAQSYKGVNDKSQTILTYVSALSLGNVRSRQITKEYNTVFRIIPNISFTFDNYKFETDSEPNNLRNVSVSWNSLILGLGPELGFDTPIGYLYLDFFANYSINWASARGNGRSVSVSKGAVVPQIELGYHFFVSNRFLVKLFARSVSQPKDLWDVILSDVSNSQITVSDANRLLSGISFAYYFPEGRNIFKNAVK